MFYSDACLKHVEEVHHCPHCKTQLSCCHTPPFHVGDGLGWGTEVMFVCLNDECPMFINSWKQFEEKYGHAASCRYMMLPGEKTGTAMMVGSKEAFTGCIIDPVAFKEKNLRYQKEKDAVAALETCLAEKNLEPVLTLILDDHAKIDHRRQACELLPQLNDLACIDPIRNHAFRNTEIEQLVNLAINGILKKHYRRECPFCAEIIKAQATTCKECGKEI